MVVKIEVINDKYMKWLEKFMDKYPRIYEDEFMFNETISYEDKIKVLNINNLYEMIRNYAKHYYISDNNEYMDSCYILKYNDNYYKLGLEIDSVCCIKTKLIKDSYIDFKDISSFYNKENTEIDKKIEYLENVINSLLNSGLSSRTIELTTKKVLKRQNL